MKYILEKKEIYLGKILSKKRRCVNLYKINFSQLEIYIYKV